MYWKDLLYFYDIFSNTKRRGVKIGVIHTIMLQFISIFKILLTHFTIIVFIKRLYCIQINISFTNEGFLESMIPGPVNADISTNSYNKEHCHNLEFDINYNNNQESNIYQNKIQTLKSTNITSELSCKADESVDRESLSFIPPNNILIFEYSNASMIRSRYFDYFNNTRFTEINLNIKEITKSNIDCSMCKECLNILYYGWSSNLTVLNNENFLDFIWFIYDLYCYSESDSLNALYKNLLPFLFSYINDKSNSNVFNNEERFLSHRKHFLPFSTVLYDKVDILFNSNTKELVFIENKQAGQNLFEMNYADEIVIRITPMAIDFINEDNSNEKNIFLCKLVFSYNICGIRISSDNIYYSEFEDANVACNFLLENPGFGKMKTSFCSIFKILEVKKEQELKSIEFERIALCDINTEFLFTIINLESLILVKCYFSDTTELLDKITKKFPKLKVLRMIGILLRNIFFNNLHLTNIKTLDLSYCCYKDKLDELKSREMKALKELKMNYCSFDYRLIEHIIIINSFEILSLRGYRFKTFETLKIYVNWQKKYLFFNFSGCRFYKFDLERFFSNLQVEILGLGDIDTSSNLIKILNQKSLHSSVRNLNLMENFLSLDVIKILDKFKFLEYLNIKNLHRDSLKLNYFKVCSSTNPLALNSSGIMDQKKYVAALEPPSYFIKEGKQLKICYRTGFLECICATNLLTSLRGINLSQNKLDSADIYRIGWLVNLHYLSVSFDDKIFSDFLREYGALKYSKLETLVLVLTNINNDIYHFVMTLPSLRNLELQRCELFDEIITSTSNLYLISLKKIILTTTKIPSDYEIILNELKSREIIVIFH